MGEWDGGFLEPTLTYPLFSILSSLLLPNPSFSSPRSLTQFLFFPQPSHLLRLSSSYSFFSISPTHSLFSFTHTHSSLGLEQEKAAEGEGRRGDRPFCMTTESATTAADGRGYGRRWARLRLLEDVRRQRRTDARAAAEAQRRRGGEGRQPFGAADGGASAGEVAHNDDCSGGGLAAAGWPPRKGGGAMERGRLHRKAMVAGRRDNRGGRSSKGEWF